MFVNETAIENIISVSIYDTRVVYRPLERVWQGGVFLNPFVFTQHPMHPNYTS